MKSITFLGPVGATFSHDAYVAMAASYGAPHITASNCQPAARNSDVLKMLCTHGGYGAIAMETRAEGRVAEPLESFIDLLHHYDDTTRPISVLGAIKMKLHFCLMTRPGVTLQSVRGIIAHPKALGACKARIAATAIPTTDASSNGEAARLVSEDEAYAMHAALGPRSAALKYGLRILNDAYEDEEAVTTFFLLGPSSEVPHIGESNRALLVFSLPHRAGSLVHALTPFERESINLIQIHSVHTSNSVYNFAIEVEATRDQLSALQRAIEAFKKETAKHIVFGPFEVQNN